MIVMIVYDSIHALLSTPDLAEDFGWVFWV